MAGVPYDRPMPDVADARSPSFGADLVAATAVTDGAHRLRPLPAFIAGSIAVVVICGVLVPFGEGLPRVVPALLLLAPVLAAALLSGRLVAATLALEAALAFALGFLPPIGSPAVELAHDIVALAIFIVVAGALGVIISTVVTSERRRSLAERSQLTLLQAVDAQRAALLRSVSHDLRTPLASIRSVITDLQSNAPYDRSTRAELLDLVAAETERLDRLVANLLSMSRIEAGAFLPDRQPVDVAELVDECTTRLQRALDHVDLVVSVPSGLPAALGDYSQLDQVMTNLIENAARHSPEGGRVTIRARAGDDTIAISVSDEGPGIPVELRDVVLEPFRGVTSSDSTGIGLAICRSIIEAHDGTISVDDEPGGGAQISFVVPTDPPVGARRR